MRSALLVFLAVIAVDSVAQVVDTQKAIAGAYVPGEAKWEQFIADGWPKKSPGNGELGIIRMSGTLGGDLTVVLGVVEGRPGFTINLPEQALEFSLPVLEYGMGINFEAGYFQSEPLELPSGRKMGGDNMARPLCQLVFTARVLAKNTCAEKKE